MESGFTCNYLDCRAILIRSKVDLTRLVFDAAWVSEVPFGHFTTRLGVPSGREVIFSPLFNTADQYTQFLGHDEQDMIRMKMRATMSDLSFGQSTPAGDDAIEADNLLPSTSIYSQLDAIASAQSPPPFRCE